MVEPLPLEGPAPALPCVSLLAHNLIRWTNHERYQTVAGIFSLLNDFRLSKGKTSLGFINPLIYSTAAKGFNDITSGSNPGCGTAGSLTLIHPRDCYFNIYKIGFTAGKGWDPVSPFPGLDRPLAYLIIGHWTWYSRLWEIANFGVDPEERRLRVSGNYKGKRVL